MFFENIVKETELITLLERKEIIVMQPKMYYYWYEG